MLTACSGQQLGRKINAAFINYKLRLDDMDHVPFFNLYRWKKIFKMCKKATIMN